MTLTTCDVCHEPAVDHVTISVGIGCGIDLCKKCMAAGGLEGPTYDTVRHNLRRVLLKALEKMVYP